MYAHKSPEHKENERDSSESKENEGARHSVSSPLRLSVGRVPFGVVVFDPNVLVETSTFVDELKWTETRETLLVSCLGSFFTLSGFEN